MPEDLQRLQRKIEEGLEAVRELKRLEAEQKKQDRPKLRLIKGGAVGAALWAGVEWLWGYKVAVAVAAVAVTFAGGVIAEQPHSPGSDPPEAVKPPASVSPSVPPPKRPKATPTPRRTSPPRTQVPARIIPPSVPASIKLKPKEKPKVTPTPSRTTTQPPSSNPAVSLPVTPTVTPSVPVVSTTSECTVDLLGVKLCLPLG